MSTVNRFLKGRQTQHAIFVLLAVFVLLMNTAVPGASARSTDHDSKQKQLLRTFLFSKIEPPLTEVQEDQVREIFEQHREELAGSIDPPRGKPRPRRTAEHKKLALEKIDQFLRARTATASAFAADLTEVLTPEQIESVRRLRGDYSAESSFFDTLFVSPAECVLQEADIPVMTTAKRVDFVRTPNACFENLPDYDFEPHYALVDGLRMHYVDEGPASGEVVLMLHGQPSWSYLYRKMIPIIAKVGYRVIAVDHIGMGRSDKPIDLTVHEFESHVSWVKLFVDALGLAQITLFVHDWGSLIGLRAAGDNLEPYARVVLANGNMALIGENENPYVFPENRDIDPSLPDFAMWNGTQTSFQDWIEYAIRAPVIPSEVVDVLTVVDPTPDELAAYDAPYPSLIYMAGPRAFPSLLVGVKGQNQPAYDNLGRYERPFLTLMGEQDARLGSEENQQNWIDHVPGAAGQPHERFDAHHFIQEDVGETLADRVVNFMMINPLQ
ncbi:MAG: haloalkane dehalogenase [Pseudomonadales bacterium]